MSIKFKELEQYISHIVRISVCFEDLSYENYTLISDIPEGKYDEMYVYGVGMIDVEFPLNVYASSAVEMPEKIRLSDGYFLGAGLEVVLWEHPREDISRCNWEFLMFKDLRYFLQSFGGFSIVKKEDWSSKVYELRDDIPQEYDELFVYGIGMEDNPEAMDEFRLKKRDTDSTWTKRIVIVLSETPRQAADEKSRRKEQVLNEVEKKYLLLVTADWNHDADEWIGIYSDNDELRNAYEKSLSELETMRKQGHYCDAQYLTIVEFTAMGSRGQEHNGSYSNFSCEQRFREVKPEELNCFKKKPADKE